MWVTADGHIRHELLPNGRYDEHRDPARSSHSPKPPGTVLRPG
jgi:hypothetical protein